MTDAENAVWRRLRARELAGWKFRRQHPIGAYVVDFICLEAGLVIELDGGQQAGSAGDAIRTEILQAAGVQGLRFWNNDGLTQMDAVLAVIFNALASRCPHPSPLQ